MIRKKKLHFYLAGDSSETFIKIISKTNQSLVTAS